VRIGITHMRVLLLLDQAAFRLRGDPPSNRWPMLVEGGRSHEQSEMSARYYLLHNAILWRSEIFGGAEDLFRWRNVVGCASQHVNRACDIVEIELPTQPDELTPREPVLLEELRYDLKVPCPGNSVGFSVQQSNVSFLAR
jgi:hypothetical protein